ncbi:MAG: M48 family metalloprotease, partial [Rhodobacterales bacterium]|nr:M48 family metalloprotease [Rhodobacterales bacterium]
PEGGMPSGRASPRTGEPLVRARLTDATAVDLAPEGGGLWLDSATFDTLTGTPWAGPDTRSGPAPPAAAAALAALAPLPNLFLRSATTLVFLYALLGAVGIALVEVYDLSLRDTLLSLAIVSAVQFAIGPWLTDITLSWLYRIDWVAPGDLPPHLAAFLDRLCAEQGIKVPRMGVLRDGAPQAFTYGWSPNTARIVISRGLLDLTEPEEAEAVVAHEVGHAVHWDMFLMTVAQFVPMVLYAIYRLAVNLRPKSSDKDQTAAVRVAVAAGAYLLYILSEYAVLWFSRGRELHADRFAGTATGNPTALASALVKIAYGLAGRKSGTGKEGDDSESGDRFRPVAALGIFDPAVARGLALKTYSPGRAADGAAAHGLDADDLKGAMRWDLWNPWAGWYELNSTHPLVARRLAHLGTQARVMGKVPLVTFDEARPESYWDDFLLDLSVHLLPTLATLGAAAAAVVPALSRNTALDLNHLVGGVLLALGPSLLLRFLFTHRGGAYPDMSVAALLKQVKVSAIRPVPCVLRGTIIGRGVPGYILSEDFVLKDDTGILFLDMRQPLALWEILFGALKGERFVGRKVAVRGWFRRGPVPYLEIKHIDTADGRTRSWSPVAKVVWGVLVTLAGLVVLTQRPFLSVPLPTLF